MSTTNTTLTFKRILISLLIFFIVPILNPLLNTVIKDSMISHTLLTNLAGFILMVINWDLLQIHAKRFASDIKEALFFTFIGIILLGISFTVNHMFLHAYVPVVNSESFNSFILFSIPILLAYSFVFAMNYVIAFKCITDRLNIKQAEITTIFLSGFLFSLLFTIFFVPFDLISWLKSYLFYLAITTIISYLYNQTKSFLPGLIALGTILLGLNLYIVFF